MPNLVARLECVGGVGERRKIGEDWQRELGKLPPRWRTPGNHSLPEAKSACLHPCICPAGHQLSLLTSLMIFKAPVGEKKKRLMLSLNLGGTLARPSARFWMASFSSWLRVAGVEGGLSIDAEGAALTPRWESVDRPERSGCAPSAMCTERKRVPRGFKPFEGGLSFLASMVDPWAWWCLTGPAALNLARRRPALLREPASRPNGC